MTDQTVEIAADELAELRAKAATPTRDLSPVKPQDHKAPAAEVVKVTRNDVVYEVRRNAMANLRFIDLMERNQLTTALRLLLGDDKFSEFLDAEDDGTGFVDADAAGELLKDIAETANLGN